MSIEEAAKKNYPLWYTDWEYGIRYDAFINGAKSDAAKEYWFEQFKAQERPARKHPASPALKQILDEIAQKQKPITDEDKIKRISQDEAKYGNRMWE